MEKVTIRLQCPKCGGKLSATIARGTNIAKAKVRCCNAECGFVGNGADFMFLRFKPFREHVCSQCGATWQTRADSKEILVCPQCGNTKDIIPKIKLS